MKVCKVCGETKPLDNYYSFKTKYKGVEKVAYRGECKDCSKNKANTKYKEERDRLGRHPSKAAQLKRKFGISLKDYEEIQEQQGNRCAICNNLEEEYTMAVDHNHNTGEVRGLLCMNCNTGLGMLKDSVQNLESAITYLKERGSYGI